MIDNKLFEGPEDNDILNKALSIGKPDLSGKPNITADQLMTKYFDTGRIPTIGSTDPKLAAEKLANELNEQKDKAAAQEYLKNYVENIKNGKAVFKNGKLDTVNSTEINKSTNTINHGDDGVKTNPPKFKNSEKEVITANTSTGVDDVTKVPDGEKTITTVEEPEVKPGGNGLEWIQHNWKAIAIVAGIGTLIALLVKSAKSIKMRYNKAVRTLARMQKDFTINKKGMDMRAVLPGVGSRITDNLTHVFSGSLFMNNGNKGVMGNKSAQKLKDGTIGLYPFCDMYKEEINNDFKMAQKVYSNIKFADDQKNEDTQHTEESFNGKVYNSFAEVFAADHINESENGKPVNESIMSLVALAPMVVRGGMFIASKLGKNGKSEPGSERAIQVTKQSTREMCYAIMNNFFEKYISFEELSKKMGVDVKGLSDIDASSVEKFKTVLRAYFNPDGGSVVKQYARLKEAYTKMCKHYFNIGDGIISNFKKYTKAEDEKHANLLVAANEKLLGLWDQQRDQYKNLFPYVLNEIITNSSYQDYIDFIIEKVLPVFGSGNASDADYILDVMPKKGDLFLLSQTGKGDNGNKAIAIVTKEYKADKKDLEIKFVGLFQGGVELNPDGSVVLTELDKKLDRKVFGNKPVLLPYSKFVALDPRSITNIEDVNAQYVINTNSLKQKKQSYIVEPNNIQGLSEKVDELCKLLMEKYGIAEDKLKEFNKVLVSLKEKSENLELQIKGLVNDSLKLDNEHKISSNTIITNIEPVDESKPEDNSEKITFKNGTEFINTTAISSEESAVPVSSEQLAEVDKGIVNGEIPTVENPESEKEKEPTPNNGAYIKLSEGNFVAILPVIKDEKNTGLKCSLYDKDGNDIKYMQLNVVSSFIRDIISKIRGNKEKMNAANFLEQLKDVKIYVNKVPYTIEVIDDINLQNAIVKNAFADLENADIADIVTVNNKDDIAKNIEKFISGAETENQQKNIKEYLIKAFNEVRTNINITDIQKDSSQNTDNQNQQNNQNNNQNQQNTQNQQSGNQTVNDQNSQNNQQVNDNAAIQNDNAAVNEKIDSTGRYVDDGALNPTKQITIAKPNIDNKILLSLADKRVDFLGILLKEILLKNNNAETSLIVKIKFAKSEQDDNSTKLYINVDNIKGSIEKVINVDDQTAFSNTVTNAIFELCGNSLVLKEGESAEPLNDSIHESFNFDVNYTVNMTESANFDINVTRNIKCNGNCSEYYILSEAIWADGNIKEPKSTLYTNMRNLFKRSKDKDSIMEYAKSTQNVNICKYAPSNTYDIKKSAGFAGNIGSPLYECCVALKFNDNGKIVNAINIGAHKISF